MFLFEMPYLVGSALTSPNWRDIDVRVLLPDRTYDDLATLIVPSQLNLVMSLWGQKVTSLPIDFQLQRRKEANEEFKGRRHPIGMKRPDPQLPTGCGECGGRLWHSVCADCGTHHQGAS